MCISVEAVYWQGQKSTGRGLVPCPFRWPQEAPCRACSLWGTPQGRFEFHTEIYSPQIALEIQI